MNTMMYKPIERMITYRALFNGEDGLSLSEVSSLSAIPIAIVRNDFAKLISSSLFGLDLYDTDDDDIADMPNTKLKKMFSDGMFDDTVFNVLDYAINDNSDTITVPVNIDEYIAYYNLAEQKSLPKKVSDEQTFVTSTIRYKKYVHEFTPDTIEKLEITEGAISDHYSIRITYAEPLSKSDTLTVIPLKIGFDATDNKYALISLYNNQIRVFDFDYIGTDIRYDTKVASPRISNDIEKVAANVWGVEFDKCFDDNFNLVNPVQVTVRFFDEANVINKLKRDLTFRNSKPIKEESGSYLYTDYVYGTDSFIKWLCSYGSSAMLISPQNLVTDFVALLKERLAHL